MFESLVPVFSILYRLAGRDAGAPGRQRRRRPFLAAPLRDEFEVEVGIFPGRARAENRIIALNRKSSGDDRSFAVRRRCWP